MCVNVSLSVCVLVFVLVCVCLSICLCVWVGGYILVLCINYEVWTFAVKYTGVLFIRNLRLSLPIVPEFP